MANITDYQQRVIDEKTQLDDKLAKLRNFFDMATFKNLDNTEKSRMYRQENVMADYSEILGERVAAFSVATP